MARPEQPCAAVLYGPGPWLILYGVGGEALAEAAKQQCRDHGVIAYSYGIDELPPDENPGVFYPGLVVILPPADYDDARRQHRKAATTVAVYRGDDRRPRGLKELLADPEGITYARAGVVQIVADRANMQREIWAEVIASVTVHYTDQLPTSMEADLFAVFDEIDPGRSNLDAPSQIEEDFSQALEDLTDFGIEDCRRAKGVKDTIDTQILFYENDRKWTLFRPLGNGVPYNRLRLLLDYPTLLPESRQSSSRKGATVDQKYKRAGQTVARETWAAIRAAHPDVVRPGRIGDRGVRGEQEALTYLWRRLKAVVGSEIFEREWSKADEAIAEQDPKGSAP